MQAHALGFCSRLASKEELRTGNAVQQVCEFVSALEVWNICFASRMRKVSTVAMASLVSRPRVFGGRPRDARTLRCALPTSTATAAAGQAVGTTVSKYVQIEKTTLPGRAEAWRCT